MTSSGYSVRALIEVRFKLGDMPLTDAHIASAQLVQKLQPAMPGVGWMVTDIDIGRGNGLPSNGSATPPQVIAQKVRERMAELGLKSTREVARRTATDPEGHVNHSTVMKILNGAPTAVRSRRRVARGLGLPTNALD